MQSDSYVIGFMQLLYVQLSQMTFNYIVDTGGTQRATVPYSLNFSANAALGVITNGIVIGTNDTAVTWQDNKLNAAIAHGTAVGQISYAAMSIAAPTNPESTITEVTLTRLMTNNCATDNPLVVKEAGLYLYIRYTTAGYCCGLRDVLPTPRTVNRTESIVIQYRLRTVT